MSIVLLLYFFECPQKGVMARSVILLYFLATAVSWSLMRPKPSIMVSSVSLLSSIVIVDSLGPPLMHGVSWSFGKQTQSCERYFEEIVRLKYGLPNITSIKIKF